MKNSSRASSLRASAASTLAFCLPLLCQCAGGPAGRWVTLGPGDQVVVHYRQGSDGHLQQTLCSGPRFSAREAYSKKDADPGLKVASLEDMQRLLDELGQNHFAAKAQPVAPAEVKQLLAVELNGRTQVFAMLPEGLARSPQDLVDFVACKQAFLRAFNATTGFSSGNTSADDLQRQQAELRERARRMTQAGAETKKTATSAGKSGRQ